MIRGPRGGIVSFWNWRGVCSRVESYGNKHVISMKVQFPVLAASLGFSFSHIQAATLAAWDTNGLAANATNVAATTVAANLTVSVVSRGPGLSNIGGTAPSNLISATGWNETSLSAAITVGDYLQFTITPDSEYEVSFATIDVNLRRTSTSATTYQWAYSLDGFATSPVMIGSSVSYTGTSTNGAAQTQLVVSSLSALQEVGGAVAFRLYAWGGTGDSSSNFGIGRLSGNDLVISGTVIPEPSGAAILGSIGVLGLLRRRR